MVDTRENEALRKIFVGGLSRQTTDETFKEHFSQYGTVGDNILMRNEEKVSRGFGFITYDSPDGPQAVFAARPHKIDDKEVECKLAMPKDMKDANSEKTTRLFVGGLSPDTTPEQLQKYIEERHETKFGTINKIDFIKHPDSNNNKGFGFLECSSTDLADRLVICEGSFQIDNGKQMTLKKADTKGGASGGRGGGSRGGRGRGGRGGGYSGNQGGGYGGQQSSSYGSPGYGGYNAPSVGGYGAPNGYGQGGYGQGGYGQGGYGQGAYGGAYGGRY